MFEMLLGGSQVAQTFFPLSGPGSKTLLKGNQTLGYFGEVSGAELFSASELVGKVGLSIGTINNFAGSQWFKFFRNGKVIYIARQPMVSAIGWNDLYNAGLAYGVKGTGLYPVGAGVEQFVPLLKNDGARDWFLKPRMMTGVGVDPAAGASGDGGEWNQLFGRIVTGTNTGVSEKWANLAAAYVGWVGSSLLGGLVMETNTNDVNQSWTRGGNADLTIISTLAKAALTSQWRPVLELIPDNQLLDPYGFVGYTVALQPPIIVDVRLNTLIDGILDPINVVTLWPSKQPVITGATYPDAALNPRDVRASTTDGQLNPFTISAAGTELISDPVNVVFSVADLNPFTISGLNAA
jgi:hypothetical protein